MRPLTSRGPWGLPCLTAASTSPRLSPKRLPRLFRHDPLTESAPLQSLTTNDVPHNGCSVRFVSLEVPRPSSAHTQGSHVAASRPPYAGRYLTRLPCVSRVSHPPDALLLPEPHGLVSCRSRSWGSHPPELFPPTKSLRLSTLATLMPSPRRAPKRSPPPDFRVWLLVGVRLSTSGVNLPPSSMLSWALSPLQGLAPPERGRRSRIAPRSTFLLPWTCSPHPFLTRKRMGSGGGAGPSESCSFRRRTRRLSPPGQPS